MVRGGSSPLGRMRKAPLSGAFLLARRRCRHRPAWWVCRHVATNNISTRGVNAPGGVSPLRIVFVERSPGLAIAMLTGGGTRAGCVGSPLLVRPQVRWAISPPPRKARARCLDAGASHGSPARPRRRGSPRPRGDCRRDRGRPRDIAVGPHRARPTRRPAEDMIDALIGDTVSTGRRMDLHTE